MQFPALDIQFWPSPPPVDSRFSILIPTWNNLPMLKKCVEAIRKHSRFPHQIVLHINEGSDGTQDWARSEDLSFTFSTENVGICFALNAAASLAKTPYLVFLNDDMFLLPGWDECFWNEIQTLGHDRFFLSGTMIEPRETGNACAIQGKDFGRDLDDFREMDLLSSFRTFPKTDWTGATWPPNIVPTRLWNLVGGYSVELSPGMGSDPDFSMKLWLAGVRYFKGLAGARAYHFQAKSTGRVKKNDGNRQFLAKYGLTMSTFHKHFLRRGETWTGPLQEPDASSGYAWDRFRSKVKKWMR